MRFGVDWGSAGTLFRLLLSKITVQVHGFIAARCNNYCSALTKLALTFTLTDQCAFPMCMFTAAGSDAYAWCNKLLQRAAIINAAPWEISCPGTWSSGQFTMVCSVSAKLQWMCNFDSAWCTKLMQRAAIIIAAPWNFGLVDCLDWVLTWSDCETLGHYQKNLPRCNKLLQRRCINRPSDRLGGLIKCLNQSGSVYQV